MAATRDLSSNVQTDVPFNYPNRTNAGEPNGSITPLYAGEIMLDTTNNCLWKGLNTTSNTSWVALTTPN